MTTEPCRSCGHPVGTRAVACPSCGQANPSPSGLKETQTALAIGAGVIVLLFVLVIGAMGSCIDAMAGL